MDSIATTSSVDNDDSQKFVDAITLTSKNLQYDYNSGLQSFTGGWFNVKRAGWNGRMTYETAAPRWVMRKGLFLWTSGETPLH